MQSCLLGTDNFEKDEIFKIYLKMSFNFQQLVNAQEVYKNLPNYKARALIYQGILLSDNIEKKIDLAFLLKDLFKEDKIFNVYAEELSNILYAVPFFAEITSTRDCSILFHESFSERFISAIFFGRNKFSSFG